jgi:hypothetical protein
VISNATRVVSWKGLNWISASNSVPPSTPKSAMVAERYSDAPNWTVLEVRARR